MSAVFYRELHHRYPVAVSASGMHIFDASGNAYLDMSGGAVVSCLGHQDPAIIAILQEQAGELAFAHSAFFTTHAQEQLARALEAKFGAPGARAYLASGGSEANETALKLAWQYWRLVDKPEKVKIISRRHSYHGNTLGALSVSGHAARRAPADTLLHTWPLIEPCYAYRHQKKGESTTDYSERCASALERALLREGPETVAAFIAETVVGASLGAVTATDGYFARIRRICDHYDILFIADEVMCGTGRTGTFFAHAQEGVLPDIVTLGKGIGAGYQPLAATIARGALVDAFASEGSDFAHGHTYTGHATACAAGVGVVDAIDQRGLLATVVEKGAELHAALEDGFAQHPFIGDIRGRGLLRAMELVADRDSKRPFANGPALARRIRMTALEKGLICYPGSADLAGEPGCHIMLAPPFIVETDHIDQTVGTLRAVLSEVLDG